MSFNSMQDSATDSQTNNLTQQQLHLQNENYDGIPSSVLND